MILFACAIVGATLIWSNEPENGSDDKTVDEVVSRSDPKNEVAVHKANNLELTEFTVSGRIVDSAGNGLVNARLIVMNFHDARLAVSTQEDGRFALGPLAVVGPVEIEITAQDFIPGHLRIGADEPDVLVTLLRTGRLEGNAIDSQSNRLIERFTVSLFADGKLNISNTPDASAIFHEQIGNFAITDLEHKQMDLFARADGYQPVIFRRIAISDQTDKVQLKFEKARTISGRVISANSGKVIPGANVYVWNSAPYIEFPRRFSYPGQSTNTSKGGTFSLNEVSRGAVTLHIRADKYVTKKVDIGQFDEGNIVVLLAPAGSVAGKLVGVDGSSPIAGGIRLVGPDSNTSRSRRSSDDGRFEIGDLPPGDYVLSARSSAGRSGEIKLTLEEGEYLANLQLQILPGNELTGRVSGLMIGEAVLDVHANLPGPFSVFSKADAAGNYVLRGLPIGMIKIVARTTKKRSLSKTIELQATTVAYLDFIFDGTASLYGQVTRGGVPLKNMPVNLLPVDRDQPSGSSRTSEDGRYVIEGMANTKYQLNINGEGRRYVTLSGSTQLDVDL